MLKSQQLFILLFYIPVLIIAAPQQKMVQVIVAPDRADWTYDVGEEVKFTVTVLRYGHPIRNVKLGYDIKPEQMPTRKTDIILLKDGEVTLNGGTLEKPGFLRCWATATVGDNTYQGYATAGFAPEKIQPTVTYPENFVDFWNKAKEENEHIPMEARMTLQPERCTYKTDVYHVSLQNYKKGSRFYGILCLPREKGTYPALLRVPGAGARPYQGEVEIADQGVITFEVGIHGVPVDMEHSVYDNMMKAAIDGYWFFNIDDPDRYYYKRVYLGCIRAVDFITSLPQFDGVNLAVTGGSQGGALSIVTAGLDERIKWLAAYYPALCDLTGYLNDRAGGWPHPFKQEWYGEWNVTEEKINTTRYYDVVNFARQIKQPGIYSWGYNDNVCPPTSMYAAYNVIDAPKELILALDTGHWTYPEQHEQTDAWLIARLKGE